MAEEENRSVVTEVEEKPNRHFRVEDGAVELPERERVNVRDLSVLQRLEAAHGDPEILLSLVGEIEESGGFSKASYRNYYVRAFSSFSIEQMATFLQSLERVESEATFASAIFANWSDDVKEEVKLHRIFAILNATPEGNMRSTLTYKLVKKTELGSIERIGEVVEHLERIDYDALGQAAAQHYRKLDRSEKYHALEVYFSICQDPAFTGWLAEDVVKDLVKEKDLAGAQEWLLRAPADQVRRGDRYLIKALVAEGTEEAIAYVNLLVDRGEMDRASDGVGLIGAHYQRADPEAALRWGESLPSEFASRTQVLYSAFYTLAKKSPKRAREIERSTVDAEDRELYKSALRNVERKNKIQ